MALAKSLNTLAKVAGVPEPFPDTSTATAENIMKEGNRLAMELGRTMYGQGRVAGTTVQFESKSVPGLENTYLDDRMMIENLRAVANRTMDQYKFRYRWQQLTNGDLNGSDIAFNDAHGPETYADAVLQKFGVPEGGFTPDAAGRRNLRAAVAARKITLDDAKQLAEALHIPLAGQ